MITMSQERWLAEAPCRTLPSMSASVSARESPLTSAQRAMWFLHRLDPANVSDNAMTVARVRARLEPGRLRAAARALADRHELLRATFHTRGEEPILRVADHAPVEVTARAMSWNDVPSPLEAARAEVERPYLLEDCPAWRIALFTMADDDHLLVISSHHLIIDLTTAPILLDELLALTFTPEAPLPALAGRFVDFVAHEAAFLSSAQGAAQLAWWREQLAGELPALELPLDLPRPRAQTYQGSSVALQLGAGLRPRVRALAARLEVTPFSVLLAAYQVLLGRWCGQESFVVGTPVPGQRGLPALTSVVGSFTNMLPLRAELSGRPSFAELVARVGRSVAGARAHAGVPLPAIVAEVVTRRDPSRPPLFQTLFTLQRTAPVELSPFYVKTERPHRTELRGVPLETVALSQAEGQLELALELVELGDDYAGELKYNTALLTAATARAMTRAYAALLEAALADPQCAIDALAMVSDEERTQLLAAGRGPAAPADGLLLDLFLAQVARAPDAIAVTDASSKLSYRQVAARASALAQELRARGAGRDQLVALDLPRGASWVIAQLAVLAAGAAYLALDPEHPPARRAHLLRAAGAIGVVTSAGRAAEIAPLVEGTARWCLEARLDQDPDAPAPWTDAPLPAAGDLAYVIFTSGSTGEPKGALLEHGGMHNHLAAKLADLAVTADDVIAQTAPPSFVIANWQALAALEVGARVAVIEREPAGEPRALLRRLESDGVTIWQVVPSMLRAVVEELEATPPAARPSLPRLRHLVPTGEALPLELARRWAALFPSVPMLNAYGCSECSDDVAHHRVVLDGPARDHQAVAPLGRPVAGVSLYLLDRHLEPVPAGAVGELWVSGVAVGRGYLGEPERSARSFRTDPFLSAGRMYRTGDLARRRPDGVIEYRGRADHQVKVRGVRVELGEIEAALASHPAVRAAAVAALADGDGDTSLVALVVPRQAAPTRDELAAHARALLPPALAPARYLLVDELPLGGTGKLDRGALAARARATLSEASAAELTARAPEAAADEPTRAALRQLWRELLARPALGDHEDFFASGGHSLLAVRLLVRVRERFGIQLPLASIFELSTVSAMARALAAAPAAEPAATDQIDLAPAAAFEPFSLTELQQAYWIGQADEQHGGPALAFLEHDLLDVSAEALAQALDRLIARHPMLRAVIRAEGLQQVLASPGPYPLEYRDLRGAAEAERAQVLAASRDELSSFTVQPDHWPLLRLRLHQLDERRARLHLGFPLILGDLQSFRVISRELGELLFRPEVPLPPLELTFRDVVSHLARQSTLAPAVRAATYWRERLATLPPAPELPLASRAPRAGAPLRRYAHVLPQAAWLAVRERARQAGLTPTALIASVYAEVLARFSASSSLTLNLLVQRRPPGHPQVDSVVGNFSSTTLLAVDLGGAASFVERARAVQTQLWRDLEHGQVSGVQVVRELARARGVGAASAMPVVLASTLHLEADQLDSDDLLGPPLSTALRTPYVWIDHQVAQTRAGLHFHWDILEERFPPGLPQAMFECYQRALAALAEHDWAWQVGPISLPAAQLEARRAANATEAPLPSGLLHEPFFTQAARTPEAMAVVAPERRLTYRELASRALALAAVLRAEGVGPQQLVAVSMHKGWEQVVAVLGVLAAGGAYLPIDAGLPRERRALLLRLGRVRVVLTQESLRAEPWPEPLRVLTVPEQAPAAPPSLAPSMAGPDQLAYVIFTSGSTGEPKGVMIHHRGALGTVLDINQRFGVGPGDRAFGVSSLSFDLSVYDLFGVLGAGATLVLPSAERALDPSHWLRLALAEGVTLWNSVPQLLQLLLEQAEHGNQRLPSLRLAMASGDWVPLDLASRIAARAPARTISLGGATEASIWSNYHEIERIDADWASIPYGRPLSNQRFHVLDDQLEPRPTWVPGELYIAGAGLALGYWDDPIKTQERFFLHPRTGERLYRTGDLGRYWPDGQLEFLGRADTQLKLGGHRVELGEIEAHLARLPGVRAAAAVAHGPARGERTLVGYVVLAPAAPPLTEGHAATLRQELARHLPAYMVPPVLVTLDRLPLTSNGKVDRAALPAPEAATRAEAGRVAPRDPLERELAALWAELLAVPEVGIDDDFFRRLGGHSFAAVRMLARVSASQGRAPSLGQFAGRPTIAALTEHLRTHDGTPRWSPLVPLGRAGAPPLYLLHPIGGNVLCYRGLADALSELSVVGVQAHGLDGAPPLDDPAELSRIYAEAIAAQAGAAPLVLGGWSMGGLMAQEVSRRLEAAGHRVAGLLLLDPATPGMIAHRSSAELGEWFVRDLARSRSPAATPALPRGASLEELVRHAQGQGLLDRTLSPDELHALYAMFCAHQTAMERHRPAPTRAPALLVAAQQGAATARELARWAELTGDLTVVRAPGDHYSLLAEDRLPELARELERFVQRANAGGLAPSPRRGQR